MVTRDGCRTGDAATLIRRAAGPCGRARRILERIDGRIEDYVVTPDGRRVGRMDHVFKDTLEVKEAQIIQTSPSQITVRLVPRSGFGPERQEEIEREFRRRIGGEMEILYEKVRAIPREPNGKFRAVVCEVEAGKLG